MPDKICPACDGKKFAKCFCDEGKVADADGKQIDCPACSGLGFYPCPNCKGAGMVPTPKEEKDAPK